MSFKRYLVPALSLRVCGQFRYNSHICLESQPGIDTQHSKKTQQKMYQYKPLSMPDSSLLTDWCRSQSPSTKSPGWW